MNIVYPLLYTWFSIKGRIMDFGIAGKVALVSGGTQGIGFASAKALLSEGAKVVIFSRNQDNVDKAVEQLGASDSQVLAVQCDLADEPSVDSMLQTIATQFGNVDIFVGSSGGPSFGEAQSISSNEMREALETNFISLATLANKLIPNMKKKKWGRIVFVTTSGVIEPVKNLALSNISRSALSAYTKTIANEIASDGITVNTVIPGRIFTDRLQTVLRKEAETKSVSYDELLELDSSAIPAGRYGEPEEIAAMITFLCSDAASYITGRKIPVDGGMLKSV